MLGSTFSTSTRNLDAEEHVERLTRERFGLEANSVVLVSEIRCQSPGCPPLETVVAFWSPEQVRYRFKVFKPVREVVRTDLPVSWLLPSLRDYGDLDCSCC